MIYAIEGIDGAGKVTQAKELTLALAQTGASVKMFSFPNYETETGKVILGNLQERWAAMTRGGCVAEQVNALALQSIFAINRYEAAAEIEDAARRGHVVLDRYWLSGVVYGTCDGLDEEWLIRIHERLPQPDVWILLDVPSEASIARRPDRRDRYEADANMGRRREIYLRLFDERKGDTSLARDSQSEQLTKWCVVNGARVPDVVHADILERLRARGLVNTLPPPKMSCGCDGSFDDGCYNCSSRKWACKDCKFPLIDAKSAPYTVVGVQKVCLRCLGAERTADEWEKIAFTGRDVR